MLPLIGFCGASNSGKTTLVSQVIAALTKKGLKVGAIKHHGHPEPLQASDQPKDSDLLLQAGAQRVALAHAGGVWLFAPPEAAQAGPAQIAADYMQGMDLVIAEGFKNADILKIEVVAPGKNPLLPQEGRILALARRGGQGQEKGLPVLNTDDPESVADFVLANLPGPSLASRETVNLKVNGADLDLNPFVAHLLEATIKGMVKKLKGGAKPSKIEVFING